MGFVARFFMLVTVLSIGELYLLVTVANEISFPLTLGLCVLTGVLGGGLVRYQGLRCLKEIQTNLSQGQVPAAEIVSGLILVVIGTLLLTPGFITDTVAFTMLVPPIRLFVARRGVAAFKKRAVVRQGGGFPGQGGFSGQAGGFSRPSSGSGAGRVIDVEGEELP
ncbi:FxsA family protein [Acanthopleuribacter pedis]|uniref:FxsA family protein n=1 Tax=Acanthopleuribacter pedis TaxID=442870 RepID=A0A8J7Q8V8_9BACT|nr:FxsA family protein [Acanthopleuribacter pedis]MBO1319069.1 FxsA family protein [Acanthopleuribacter pedis]